MRVRVCPRDGECTSLDPIPIFHSPALLGIRVEASVYKSGNDSQQQSGKPENAVNTAEFATQIYYN